MSAEREPRATDAIEFAHSGYVERWDELRAIATPLIAALSARRRRRR